METAYSGMMVAGLWSVVGLGGDADKKEPSMAVGEGWRASSRHGCPLRPHPTYAETTLPRTGRLVRAPNPRRDVLRTIDQNGRKFNRLARELHPTRPSRCRLNWPKP